MARRFSSAKHLSLSYLQQAEYYMLNEDYGNATVFVLESMKTEETLNNKRQIAFLNEKLGIIYRKMEKFVKSGEYFEKALKIYQSLGDSAGIAQVYSRIGQLHGAREYCEFRTIPQRRVDYTTAIEYLEKSKGICIRNRFENILVGVYLNLASVYNRFEQSGTALIYVQKAMDYYRKTNNIDGIANTLYSLGITYRKLKQFEKAQEYFHETIRFGKENHITEGLQFVYEELSQAYYEAGDFKRSRDYYVQYMILRDSVYSIEKSKQIFELETKYQSEKKENQILALSLEKNRKQLIVYILLSVLLVVGLISLYLIHRAKNKTIIAEQKNHINEQKIREMEKEKQLIAIHAVLHGEENERSRLSRDLHDGLGGLLSGLKLSLTNMKGNVLLTQENVQHFNHALGLLDTSMNELRRVAHNMMPEALSRFGLKDALADFCAGIGNSDVSIKFRYHGHAKRFDQNMEINIYRIAQELVNNAVKHSGASDILLMIVQDEGRIHMTIEDNGCGFDPHNKNNYNGAGLTNIQSRVDSMNGDLQITSAPGKGTEISVEFRIPS